MTSKTPPPARVLEWSETQKEAYATLRRRAVKKGCGSWFDVGANVDAMVAELAAGIEARERSTESRKHHRTHKRAKPRPEEEETEKEEEEAEKKEEEAEEEKEEAEKKEEEAEEEKEEAEEEKEEAEEEKEEEMAQAPVTQPQRLALPSVAWAGITPEPWYPPQEIRRKTEPTPETFRLVAGVVNKMWGPLGSNFEANTLRLLELPQLHHDVFIINKALKYASDAERLSLTPEAQQYLSSIEEILSRRVPLNHQMLAKLDADVARLVIGTQALMPENYPNVYTTYFSALEDRDLRELVAYLL